MLLGTPGSGKTTLRRLQLDDAREQRDSGGPRPAHTVRVAAFEIGQFPVTNAELKCFMDAGGYDDERWWDTAAAKAWHSGGESAAEGDRRKWGLTRENFKRHWTVEQMRARLPGRGYSPNDLEFYIRLRNWSDEEFDDWLDKNVEPGRKREPAFWDDPRFNKRGQGVIGVCWHEARAYCNWLSASAQSKNFRLPTEAEWEAAARGPSGSSGSGRRYAYSDDFDVHLCNTTEGRVRRTTPVGVYPGGATPEGVHDLTGNAWEWTLSSWGADLFNAPEFRYPYSERRAEREDVNAPDTMLRVVRGGSWNFTPDSARCAVRTGSSQSIATTTAVFVSCVLPPLFLSSATFVLIEREDAALAVEAVIGV